MNTPELIEDLRMLSPPDFTPWWVVAAVVIAAVCVFLLLRRRGLAQAQRSHAGYPRATWELAMAELERLAPMLRAEHSREYGIASTAILRRYIEERYALNAPKLATEEFLRMSGESPAIPPAHQGSLRYYLEVSDLLKFGRYVASTAELMRLHEAAVGFVLASQPDAMVGVEGKTA